MGLSTTLAHIGSRGRLAHEADCRAYATLGRFADIKPVPSGPEYSGILAVTQLTAAATAGSTVVEVQSSEEFIAHEGCYLVIFTPAPPSGSPPGTPPVSNGEVLLLESCGDDPATLTLFSELELNHPVGDLVVACSSLPSPKDYDWVYEQALAVNWPPADSPYLDPHPYAVYVSTDPAEGQPPFVEGQNIIIVGTGAEGMERLDRARIGHWEFETFEHFPATEDHPEMWGIWVWPYCQYPHPAGDMVFGDTFVWHWALIIVNAIGYETVVSTTSSYRSGGGEDMALLPQGRSTTILSDPFVRLTGNISTDLNGQGGDFNEGDIYLTLDGGQPFHPSTQQYPSHVANGCYAITLSAADLAECGELRLTCALALHFPVNMRFTVVPAELYDAWRGAQGGSMLAAADTAKLDTILEDTSEALPGAVAEAADKADAAKASADEAARPGDAMTLTAAYDAAKTAAQPGDAMTLVVEALDADRMTDDAVARIQHDALDRLDEIDGDIQRLAESVSGGTGANDVSFCVRDQAGSPVVGAVIRLYADAQRSTLAYWGIASAAGRLTFHLPDGTYYPTVIAWGVRTDYDPISVGGQ